MKDALYIAWKYIVFNKIKTITLIACITITIFLPISLEVILNASEKQLLHRAQSSPLLIGPQGSALDLSMNALYFSDDLSSYTTLNTFEEIKATDLGTAIPLYVRFKAREFPIIGTNLDYFHLRQLRIKEGRNLARLGECVIGSKVAKALDLKTGDFIVSSPENLFDIAGVYPLKMTIVGIFEDSNSPDDQGIFVDLKTSWIIEGLGHGHQDLSKINDPTLIASKNDSVITATSKLMQYNEIDGKNMDSFHFHGETTGYPISSVLVFPNNQKAEALLRGRYVGKSLNFQITKPTDVIQELLENIFKIRNVLDTVIAIVAMATLVAMILIFVLSLRLRAQEIETIFKLGCRKGTVKRILAAEIAMILLSSILVCGILLLGVHTIKYDIINLLLF